MLLVWKNLLNLSALPSSYKNKKGEEAAEREKKKESVLYVVFAVDIIYFLSNRED